MSEILDWINPEEFFPLVVLICLLAFVGTQMTRPEARAHQWARRCSGWTFFAYTAAGLWEWGATGFGDLLAIAIRALLAAGFVGVVAMTMFPAVEYFKGVLGAWHDTWRRQAENAELQAKNRSRRREEADRDRSDRARQESERQQRADEAARIERERHTKTDDACSEVIRFYDEHADLLAEFLPQSLFRSQLQTKFPSSVTPEQAWLAAQEMIASMLTIIGQAREKRRAELEDARKAEEAAKQEERRRNEPEEKRQAVHKLTDWYQKEKEAIEQRLPEGLDREDVLRELFTRYDRLMKEALQEIKL